MSIRLLSVLCYLLGVVGLFALMDRLLMGAYQRRSGPYSIGWFGLLQPIVDGIKLIKKRINHTSKIECYGLVKFTYFII
jgi:NADH:ubiquinone oxidoreductase subunit H